MAANHQEQGLSGKNKLNAYQASERGGDVFVENLDYDRVKISGNAVLYFLFVFMITST